MELGRTPLFVDNTNICLWEMREYMSLADRFGYQVQVISPHILGPGSLDPKVLSGRIGEGAAGRASGKHIPHNVLERMVGNLEELPQGTGPTDDASLQAIRTAAGGGPPRPQQAPPRPQQQWQQAQPPQPQRAGPVPQARGSASDSTVPRYAGLDVEAKALAALGAVELGPLFWGESAETVPHECNIFDARCKENSEWRLPPRLHVTVKFFGAEPNQTDLAEVRALADTWHEVEATALVFVQGGGLLCVECALRGPGATSLQHLGGEGWRPHVTLLTAAPWQAKDSTAVLRAWERAKAAQKGQQEGAGDGTDAGAGDDDVIVLEESSDEDDEDADLRASLQSVLKPAGESAAQAAEAAGGEQQNVEVLNQVSVLGRQVNLCRLALQPPPVLGPCKFKLFYA